MSEPMLVSEWDCDTFHKRVREMQDWGYDAIEQTYRITPEMNPENGQIIHLYSIEMRKPDQPGSEI